MRRAVSVAVLSILATSCVSSGAAGIDCRAGPSRLVTVFLEGEHERVTTLHGATLQGAPDGTAFPRYPLVDGAGTIRRLIFDNPSGPLPMAPGVPYDLRVEYVMGMPSPCAIVLNDAQGLVLLAVADLGIGDRVLKEGLPGWEFKLVPTSCPSRASDKCYASRVNLVLEATHAGRSVRLMNGQSAALDEYDITCHAAEKVEYRSGCADAGLLEVSFTVRRRAA